MDAMKDKVEWELITDLRHTSQCVDDYAVPRKTETRILVATIPRRKPLERPKQMLPIGP